MRPAMTRRWPLLLTATFLLGISGCVNLRQNPVPRTPLAPEAKRDSSVIPATYEAMKMEKVAPTQTPSAVSNEAALVATDLGGPQPLDVLVRHALEENRTVRAAQFNVLALKHRIHQVTALDDPLVSNTIFPIPSAAPQCVLMGYMPYAGLLVQQFPWCGTLRMRGQAAEDDVKIALFELAAAQLDVVANVKRAYYDLHFNERLKMDCRVVPTTGRSAHPTASCRAPGRYERTQRTPGTAANFPGEFPGGGGATNATTTRTLRAY